MFATLSLPLSLFFSGLSVVLHCVAKVLSESLGDSKKRGMESTYLSARIPHTEAERARYLQSSVLAKRPRSQYEYDDPLLSRTYVTRRWGEPRLGQRGPDRVGVQSLRESREQYAPLAPYNYDDYRSELPIRGSENVAASTLFVEGLPSDCSRRESAHIFRHFQGFKEMRIVNKSKEPTNQAEGEASVNHVVLCFVDFENPKCAAAAMEALQGYRFDKNDRDSPSLKLKFAYPHRNRSRNRNGSSFARSNDRFARINSRRRSF